MWGLEGRTEEEWLEKHLSEEDVDIEPEPQKASVHSAASGVRPTDRQIRWLRENGFDPQQYTKLQAAALLTGLMRNSPSLLRWLKMGIKPGASARCYKLATLADPWRPCRVLAVYMAHVGSTRHGGRLAVIIRGGASATVAFDNGEVRVNMKYIVAAPGV